MLWFLSAKPFDDIRREHRNDAELDGETGTYVRPAPTKHTRAVCSDIARVGVEQHYANVEAAAEAKSVVRELAPQVARCARELDEQPTCYICLEGGDGLVRSWFWSLATA